MDMKQKLNSKKIIIITAVTLGVVAMGFLYVLVGSNVLNRLPKTEVADTSQDAEAKRLAQDANPTSQPLPEAPLVPTPMPATPRQPAPTPAAATSAPKEPTETAKTPTGLNKKFRKFVSLLPGGSL